MDAALISGMVEKNAISMEILTVERFFQGRSLVITTETRTACDTLSIPESYQLQIAHARMCDIGSRGRGYNMDDDGQLGFDPFPFAWDDGNPIHPKTLYRVDGLEHLMMEPCVGFSVLGPSLFHLTTISTPSMSFILSAASEKLMEEELHPVNNKHIHPFMARLMQSATPVMVADLESKKYYTFYKLDATAMKAVHSALSATVPAGRTSEFDKYVMCACRVLQAVPVVAINNVTSRPATLVYIDYKLANDFLEFDKMDYNE